MSTEARQSRGQTMPGVGRKRQQTGRAASRLNPRRHDLMLTRRWLYSRTFGCFRPASVAQLAEQLICNQQVVGSSPSASSSSGRGQADRVCSRWREVTTSRSRNICLRTRCGASGCAVCHGGFPERSKGSDCKSDGNAFTGSNPVPPTRSELFPRRRQHLNPRHEATRVRGKRSTERTPEGIRVREFERGGLHGPSHGAALKALAPRDIVRLATNVQNTGLVRWLRAFPGRDKSNRTADLWFGPSLTPFVSARSRLKDHPVLAWSPGSRPRLVFADGITPTRGCSSMVEP